MQKGLSAGAGLLAGVVIAVVLAVGLMVFIAPQFLGNINQGGININGGNEGGPGITDTAVCLGGQTQSYDPNCYDTRAPGTALTEAYLIYRQVGEVAWTAGTEGTAITALETGKDYEFVYGISLTDFTDNAFGPHVIVRNLPCIKVESTALYQDAAASAVTTTFFNQNDAAAFASIGSGTDTTVSFKEQATSKVIYGNPYIKNDALMTDIDSGHHRKAYPNCACIQANDTTHDTASVFSYIKDANGVRVDMNRISVPTALAAATGDVSWCFESPVISDTDFRQYYGLDIATVSGGPLDDGTLTIYAGDYYIDSDTGALAWGCETNAGAVIGIGTPETGTLDESA